MTCPNADCNLSRWTSVCPCHGRESCGWRRCIHCGTAVDRFTGQSRPFMDEEIPPSWWDRLRGRVLYAWTAIRWA